MDAEDDKREELMKGVEWEASTKKNSGIRGRWLVYGEYMIVAVDGRRGKLD